MHQINPLKTSEFSYPSVATRNIEFKFNMNRDTSGFVQKVEVSTAGRTAKLSRILHVFFEGGEEWGK